MPTTTLYLNKFQRYAFLGFIPFPLGGLLWIGLNFSLDFSSFPNVLFLLPVLLAVMMLAAVGYMQALFWHYRLEFGPEAVAFKTIPHPALRPWQLAYADIRRVVYWPKLWQLWIVPHQGEARPLPLTGFAGGAPALLAALGQHLPPEKIQLGAEPLAQAQRRIFWVWGVVLVAMVLAPVPIYAQLGSRWLAGSVAWQTAYQPKFLTYINTFTVAPNETIWLLHHVDPDDYQVTRWQNGVTQSWPLPPAAERPPLVYDNFPASYTPSNSPQLVWGDAQGQPAVLLMSDDVLHWNGVQWEVQPFPTGQHFSSLSMVVSGHALWAIGSTPEKIRPDTLRRLDVLAGEVAIITPTMPNLPAVQEFYGLRAGPNHSLLVQADVADGTTRLLRYADAQWEQLAAWPAGDIFFREVVLDTTGQLWALARPRLAFGTEGYRIGRYLSDKQDWQWLDFPNQEDLRSFEVDALGRLWLKDFSGVEVVRVTPTNTVQSLVRYTPENSSYQDNHESLQLSATGRLWTGTNRLVWIDTTATTLPEPLPAWMTMNTQQRSVWIIISAVIQGVIVLPGMAFAFWLTTRAQKELKQAVQATL